MIFIKKKDGFYKFQKKKIIKMKEIIEIMQTVMKIMKEKFDKKSRLLNYDRDDINDLISFFQTYLCLQKFPQKNLKVSL